MATKAEATKKTIVWSVVNTILGIAPVVITWLISIMPLSDNTTTAANKVYRQLIAEGAIHFFFLAIIGAATVDVYLEMDRLRPKQAMNLIIVGILAICLIIFVYVVFLLGGDENHNLGQAQWIFRFTALFSLVFCAFAKYSVSLVQK